MMMTQRGVDTKTPTYKLPSRFTLDTTKVLVCRWLLAGILMFENQRCSIYVCLARSRSRGPQAANEPSTRSLYLGIYGGARHGPLFHGSLWAGGRTAVWFYVQNVCSRLFCWCPDFFMPVSLPVYVD